MHKIILVPIDPEMPVQVISSERHYWEINSIWRQKIKCEISFLLR